VAPAAFPVLPHVAPDNIEKATGRLLAYRSVRDDGVTSSKHRFFAGQILYSKIRPNLSKAVRIDFDGLCSADMYPLTARIDARYFHIYLLSRTFRDQVVQRDNRLAMPKVNQAQLLATAVAVPPLAEQRRIADQVDHLMQLCDALEHELQRKEQHAAALVDAVVANLVGG
jgi:type I restriction enzyme S subunit